MDCADYRLRGHCHPYRPERYQLHGRNVVKGKKEILVGVSSNEDFLVFQRLLDELENIDKARRAMQWYRNDLLRRQLPCHLLLELLF